MRLDSESPQMSGLFEHSFVLFAALAAAVILLIGCAKQSPGPVQPASEPSAVKTLKAIDWRDSVPAEEFHQTSKGVWLSKTIEAEFPFDELIYSWMARLPEKEGFRLYLQVEFEEGDRSPWLYAGYWGDVDLIQGSKRTDPTFDRGHIAMDQLLLKQKAHAYQFKVMDRGENPLSTPPSLTVITTDNAPTPELAEMYAPVYAAVEYPQIILDLPLRRQADSQGNPMPNRCQSAAVATAMEYFGKSVPIEEIVKYTNDPEYDYPGIWPRTIGAAVQFGFEGYIDRFRDWTSVRQTLAENKVILCSIRMPEGKYKAPPYPSIGGHIVALNGVTEDGRVVVTDSALAKSGRGYRCQWLQEDFEKIWWDTKGGVGMVIVPPKNAKEKVVKDVAPFPKDRGPVDFSQEL